MIQDKSFSFSELNLGPFIHSFIDSANIYGVPGPVLGINTTHELKELLV